MKIVYIIIVSLLIVIQSGCRKLIKIEPPSNLLTTKAVFETPEQAKSALAAIYYRMVNGSSAFSSGQLTLYAGLSADEFLLFDPNNQVYGEFYRNDILPNNNSLRNIFWAYTYQLIFQTNAVLENVPKANFSDSIKNEMLGESSFLRAFCYFYLVNMFGPVPIISTTNWQKTNLLSRNSEMEVYNFIEADLANARERLSKRFSALGGERTIPNYYAAAALLARVYMFQKKWEEAGRLSSEVISATNSFSLVTVDKIYSPNNNEAIWQLKQQNTQSNLFSSPEGRIFIPRLKNSAIIPVVYLYSEFLDSFEMGDRRKVAWVDSTRLTTNKLTYYYPYKYKIGNGQTGSNYAEYHTVLRLSEQFLIRAESRMNQGKLREAIDDLNVVRLRAGLTNLDYSSDMENVKAKLIKERSIEMFAEWGCRWFDLKRWGLTDKALSRIQNKNWKETDGLYPIPVSEIATNPNLTQNPGYE